MTANRFFSLFIIAFFGVVVFSNSFQAVFQLDDGEAILNNHLIRSLGNIGIIFHATSTRFIPFLTFALNYQLNELNVFGYHLVKYDHQYFKIASLEKAILDYFYVHPDIKGKNDFESLRINKDIFSERIHEEILHQYLENFAQKALTKRIRSFWEFMTHA